MAAIAEILGVDAEHAEILGAAEYSPFHPRQTPLEIKAKQPAEDPAPFIKRFDFINVGVKFEGNVLFLSGVLDSQFPFAEVRRLLEDKPKDAEKDGGETA